MIFSAHYFCIFLVLLELVNYLNGKPQFIWPNESLDETFDNETVTDGTTRRSAREAADTKRNKTKAKEERILNTSSQRGSISFGSEQDIIFPDSYELTLEPIPRIDGPPKCADGSTFCENIDAYPYLHLKDILRTQDINKDFFFGQDEIPPELEQRVGADEEIFVCGAVDRIVFPKIGKNKDNEWKYIVNLSKEDGYVQGVRTETCRHQDGPCDIIGELPNGYRTSCKQKYIYRKLMSLSDKGMPVPDTFQLPSACCCSYKRDFGFLTRIGKAETPVK